MSVRIGLQGYGKFGGALGRLLEEGGVRYRALDPAAAVPPECRAGSLRELVDGAEFVALAVPIRAMPGVLDAVAPLLAPEQVLFDVASVKVLPAKWMEERLGRQPRAGVHPLFGPVSLARAERPLRTVVCALPGQDAAARRVSDLFAELGCEVLAQTPEDHDRVMASTHALTFFLAKGLLDMGAGADLPFAPPSFHAIQRTLDSVRGDAGHLFTGIQNMNPFAAEARAGLLRALQAIDAGLGAGLGTGDEGGEVPGLLTIPDLGQHSPALQETREMIDDLDRELVSLLARRAELSRRAGRAKAALGAPVLDPAREASLMKARGTWAAEAGLDPDAVLEVFQAVLRGSRKAQGERP
jgi:prephenate dehydrogenase